MKRIQMGIAALSVIVAGAAASGFKTAPKKPAATGWFQYTGANQTAASFNATANYTFSSTKPTCSSSGKLCAISVVVTATTGTHILVGGSGTFGAPLGTNIAGDLTNRAPYSAAGPNGDVNALNHN